jgi:penicillin-binding protein 2
MLTGRELRRNWHELRTDTLNPLYNRPLMATYPPGSIFKLAIALAALEEGVIAESTFYGCGGGFKRNKGKPGCRMHPSPLSLKNGIKYSCNSYFAATYMDFLQSRKFADIYEAYNVWYDHMASLGIGQILNVDIPYEKSGLLPSADMYDNEKRWYGKNRWKASTIISNAIGQGEILMTPVQMANLVAIIANRGYFHDPHFVKAIRSQDAEGKWLSKDFPIHRTRIDAQHYSLVTDAMEMVVSEGTARRAFISNVEVCGKTGTVQNPHGEDHATFIGFAPKHNPRIAIAVIIENAGGGGRWAAPTASVMIEKYINGSIQEKQMEYERILEADFIHIQ